MLATEQKIENSQKLIEASKQNLVEAFHIFAMLEMDDLTYTHISIRHPLYKGRYFINPLGPLFEEIEKDHILEVDFNGTIIGEKKHNYNPTGECIHHTIYKARPDVNAIMHLHTEDGVAVSSLECGLLPLSQFALHFNNLIGYHDYNGLILDEDCGEALIQDLKQNKAMILRNHGLLTLGSTIQETFFYMYYLNQSCKTQVKALSMNQTLKLPEKKIIEKAQNQMRNFEENLGQRDWNALVRKLNRTQKTTA